MAKNKETVYCSSMSGLWVVGWLFTIGYLKLGFWMGLFAVVVWPYFLGGHFAESPAQETQGKAKVSQIETWVSDARIV